MLKKGFVFGIKNRITGYRDMRGSQSFKKEFKSKAGFSEGIMQQKCIALGLAVLFSVFY